MQKSNEEMTGRKRKAGRTADLKMVRIVKSNSLPIAELDAIIAEANEEGWLFLNRLVDEWRSGANRFDGVGEALFLAYRQGKLVGICGLNIDPYAHDPRIGRVRHLFVSRSHRRCSIGRMLIEAVRAEAKRTFRELRLTTDSRDAGAFYRRMGFQRLRNSQHATHCLSTSDTPTPLHCRAHTQRLA